MQDLTPQLRTRLGRVERAVGFFVGLATLLLLAGFSYYVYHTAARKGWFDTKVSYYTYLRSGAGLKVGDTVKMMGFEVGEITRIAPEKPEAGWNVYVEFTVRGENIGYVWTEGTVAVVGSSGVFGSRYIELTKGTNGFSMFVFHNATEVPLNVLRSKPGQYVYATNYFAGERALAEAANNVETNSLAALEAAGVGKASVFDRYARAESRPKYAWFDARFFNAGYYNYYVPVTGRGKTESKVFIFAREPVVLAEAIEDVTKRVKDALPVMLALTNQIAGILDTSHTMLSNVNTFITTARPLVNQASNLLADAQPAVRNVGRITGNLTNAQGSLGEWLITQDLNRQIETTLATARATLASVTNSLGTLTVTTTNTMTTIAGSATNTMAKVDATLGDARGLMKTADTNLAAIVLELSKSLDSLAGITANLHRQVDANTNIVKSISDTIMHTDELLQGLKRHWLLRSAFRTNTPPKASSPPPKPGLQPGLPPRKD
ncbi:MAG: MCE family protein [Verrucomicrobia bacterium]|nr:MCE family protein [Verrucomicrobiota bacterium]